MKQLDNKEIAIVSGGLFALHFPDPMFDIRLDDQQRKFFYEIALKKETPVQRPELPGVPTCPKHFAK